MVVMPEMMGLRLLEVGIGFTQDFPGVTPEVSGKSQKDTGSHYYLNIDFLLQRTCLPKLNFLSRIDF